MNIPDQKQAVLVWDLPVRVFHWLLVISFAGAWLTAEGESQQMLHYAFGYTACALVLFRIIWGLIGTRYARFSEFTRGPEETGRHIKALLTGNKDFGLGHNPVGALVMISLMVLILLIGLTGYGIIKEFYGEWVEGAHETIANIAIAVVVIHIAAAIIMSFMQKENLVRSMLTGKKQGLPEQAIPSAQYLTGLFLLLAWAYCFYMVYSGAWPSLTQ